MRRMVLHTYDETDGFDAQLLNDVPYREVLPAVIRQAQGTVGIHRVKALLLYMTVVGVGWESQSMIINK